jgi:Aldo/keto reductase family
LTEISLGCAQLGNLYRAISDEQARATVHAAWERGIRYFDTAPRLERGLPQCGDLSLSPADIEALLELAREAAHESGEKRTRRSSPISSASPPHAARPPRCREVIDLALGHGK